LSRDSRFGELLCEEKGRGRANFRDLRLEGKGGGRTDGLAANDLAKDDVLSIEMGRGGTGDKELGTVGIGTCIGLGAAG
jgi:hypothetical protein